MAEPPRQSIALHRKDAEENPAYHDDSMVAPPPVVDGDAALHVGRVDAQQQPLPQLQVGDVHLSTAESAKRRPSVRAKAVAEKAAKAAAAAAASKASSSSARPKKQTRKGKKKRKRSPSLSPFPLTHAGLMMALEARARVKKLRGEESSESSEESDESDISSGNRKKTQGRASVASSAEEGEQSEAEAPVGGSCSKAKQQRGGGGSRRGRPSAAAAARAAERESSGSEESDDEKDGGRKRSGKRPAASLKARNEVKKAVMKPTKQSLKTRRYGEAKIAEHMTFVGLYYDCSNSYFAEVTSKIKKDCGLKMNELRVGEHITVIYDDGLKYEAEIIGFGRTKLECDSVIDVHAARRLTAEKVVTAEVDEDRYDEEAEEPMERVEQQQRGGEAAGTSAEKKEERLGSEWVPYVAKPVMGARKTAAKAKEDTVAVKTAAAAAASQQKAAAAAAVRGNLVRPAHNTCNQPQGHQPGQFGRQSNRRPEQHQLQPQHVIPDEGGFAGMEHESDDE